MSSNNNNNSSNGKFNRRKNSNKKGNNNKDSNTSKTVSNKNKFQGRTDGLEGHIFDCSSRNQADIFNKTMKEIVDYSARELKYGIDIRYLLHELKEPSIPSPTEPDETTYKNSLTARLMFSKQIDQHIKHMK